MASIGVSGLSWARANGSRAPDSLLAFGHGPVAGFGASSDEELLISIGAVG